MKKLSYILLLVFVLLYIPRCGQTGTDSNSADRTVVNLFGQIKTDGNQLLDQNGQPVALRGMSLFWSQWGGQYYNKETIQWLRDDWKCTVIRAALGVEMGGYLENQLLELTKLYAAIDACIDLGIYVIVDWHDHHGEQHLPQAVELFDAVSSKYGSHPNIIYELYNEPLQVSWKNVIKPYADSLISVIRHNDPDNLIIVGTPNWSQDVDDVIGNEITDHNVAYVLHFYTGTHRQWLRDKANQALKSGIPLFVSEWGLSEADGSGNLDMEETVRWMDYLEANNLSWCNWSVINKEESSAALLAGTSTLSGWSEDELSQSGKMIRDYLIRMNSTIFDQIQGESNP